jgi:hypothetical protein
VGRGKCHADLSVDREKQSTIAAYSSKRFKKEGQPVKIEELLDCCDSY